MGENGEGVKLNRFVVAEQPHRLAYSTGYVVNVIEINGEGARRAFEAAGGPLYKVHDFLTTLLYI